MSTSAELASAATAAAKIIEEAPFAAASMPALVKYLDLQVRSSIPSTRTETRTENRECRVAQRTRTHCSPGSQAGRPPTSCVAASLFGSNVMFTNTITPKHPNTQTPKTKHAQIQHGAVDSDANRCLVKLCQLHPAQCADASVLARALTQALTNMPLTDFVDQYSLLSEEMVCVIARRICIPMRESC
jgi:hypothetical protein